MNIQFLKQTMKAQLLKMFTISALLTLGGAGALTSCSDMFETESDRQIFDPALDEKTDSMFYLLGIMKGMQQVADQYVLTNEMRGDLVATNSYTETDLRRLANFTADITCKYDSAYKYYRIINNCNYFITHRDSTLMTGSTRVTIPEIAQAHAVRAWAYLQLVKTYGRVPFYTNPLVSIDDASHIPDSIDMQNIVDKLVPGLSRYVGVSEPNYGWISAGVLNTSSTEKKLISRNIMIPVEVILGDLYLETHNYPDAAKSYFAYIKRVGLSTGNYGVWPNDTKYKKQLGTKIPTNMPESADLSSWSSIFAMDSPKDSVTYVPLAANRLRGQTTELPRYFGYNFYSTTGGTDFYLLGRQIDPSSSYLALSDKQEFYYKPIKPIVSTKDTVLAASIGDMRRYASFWNSTTSEIKYDSTFTVMTKFNNANVALYRASTIYLRLAEAVNRWGYPDLAFAILKDGIKASLFKYRKVMTSPLQNAYIEPRTVQLLQNQLPFITSTTTGGMTTYYCIVSNNGIHSRGTYYTQEEKSPYQMDAIVKQKMEELKKKKDEGGMGIAPTGSLRDTINAVEDLICDELALELAFEGTRFGDLTRMARHKNRDGLYGGNYGSEWLANKLAYKKPMKDLKQEQNWYLPFK